MAGNSLHEADPDINLEWLPSVPITKKRRVPPVVGIAIFYSEQREELLAVYQTNNLRDLMGNTSREQARALNFDADCRVVWMEMPEGPERSCLAGRLRRKAASRNVAA